MDADPSTRGDFCLGDWDVQPALCRLSQNGRTVQVRPKVMDLLVFLAAAPGAVISKETLLNEVWRTEAVSESALTRTVTELRQALGDSVESPHILETIPKRGYRLIAHVSDGRPSLAPVPVPVSTKSPHVRADPGVTDGAGGRGRAVLHGPRQTSGDSDGGQ
jgi:DNA-binding winged helix-turn-helix (wHTH) protein